MSVLDLRRESHRVLSSIFLHLFLTVFVVSKVQHDPSTPLPTFGDPIQNITVIKGRDITFTCIVKHLGQYKVGWVKADTKAIQAIHHQVVTHNPRVSVTYRDKTTWSLHIKDVQEDDHGVYMCQVNTDPMIAEMAFLEVVVPPEILDDESSGETEVDEGSSASLVCKAKGHPTPKVSWQKENGEKIVLRDQGAKKVLIVEGETLNLTKVKRQDMGPYLCIANNKIPPSVSKRIMMRVNFKPVLDVPLHMYGSPLGNNVNISCRVEASPKAVNTWRKVPGEQMIISSMKYDVRERHEGYYVTHMELIIKNFTRSDATNYVCSSSNSLGSNKATIQVYEIPTPKEEIEAEAKEELHAREENELLKKSREKVPKHSLKGQGNRNRLENLLDTYPGGGKKALNGDYDGGLRRVTESGNHDLFDTSLGEESTQQREEGDGKVFTFFGSGQVSKAKEGNLLLSCSAVVVVSITSWLRLGLL